MSKNIDYKCEYWLYHQYTNKKKTLVQIGEMCGVTNATILNWMQKFNLTRRKAARQIGHCGTGTGEEHPQWKGGGQSYWNREARKIWARHYNYKIPGGFLIHHRDEDYTNNTMENLVMLTHGLHLKVHNRKRRDR